MNNEFDAIIIGSGMGGLTCASLLAQLYKKRVLILERHFTVGGYTHMFKRRKKFEWDVGLHYVGEMQSGSRYRFLFDYVTKNRVDWFEMRDCYDTFKYPNLSFEVFAGIDRFKGDLISRFPDEQRAIEQYFVDVTKTARWFGRLMFSKLIPQAAQFLCRSMTGPGSKLALMTTRNYFDQQFSDYKLRGLLASQWGNFGLPPHKSAFAIHALTVCHMLDGGYYPIGGAKAIADAIIPIVENKGGKLLLRHQVDQIIVENGVAKGVSVKSRRRGKTVYESFYSDLVISNTGALITYDQLIPKTANVRIPNQFNAFPSGISQVCLYLGLKDSPKKLGFKGDNHWIYKGYDHDALYHQRNDVLNGDISACFLSFPSLKNPLAKGHTAEAISFLDYQPFQSWADKRWQKRGDDYELIKSRVTDGMINLLDRYYPGFSNLIEYSELSTPLTISEFTGHYQGAVHGLAGVPEKFSADWLSPRTPIKNLYLTGADIAGHGIIGAFMAGFLTLLVACSNKIPLWILLSKAQYKSMITNRY